MSTTVNDVCRYVRSKNAGPFWVTVDFFFDGPASYAKYHASPALGPALFAQLYGVDAAQVKSYAVPSLNTLKVSYPRLAPQGGVTERDLHAGQQYVRLLAVALD